MPQTLHVVAALTNATRSVFVYAWSSADRVAVLSRQARASLHGASIPFEFIGDRYGPTWAGLHGMVGGRLDWAAVTANDRWDWEPFLLHEVTRDLILCDFVYRVVQRHRPPAIRWWNEQREAELNPFTAVEKLLSGLTVPVWRGGNERAALLP